MPTTTSVQEVFDTIGARITKSEVEMLESLLRMRITEIETMKLSVAEKNALAVEYKRVSSKLSVIKRYV